MRKKIIAGNWKMNKTPAEAVALVNEMKAKITSADCDVVVCPTAVCLPGVIDAAKDSIIKVGAQNVHFKESGAYTGELAGNMLKEIGTEYVIIGHSERRQYFGETDETVNARTIAALGAGLIPIVCVGESLTEREQGITDDTVRRQTKIAFLGIDAKAAEGIIIAYEPVWAIGTGVTATADQADEGNGYVRAAVAEMFGAEVANATVVQYGGSMNDKNAAELLSKENVDGGLFGGASLKAGAFSAIVDAAQ